jgi:hypothetical protein
MRRGLLRTIAGALASYVTSVGAHHSWATVYDTSKSTSVEGVVTEFLFRSPHLALKLDVHNSAGDIEHWTVEWGSPKRLAAAGYDKNTLRPGDVVTVTGQPARVPGQKLVRLRSLTRASDGFELSGRGGNAAAR